MRNDKPRPVFSAATLCLVLLWAGCAAGRRPARMADAAEPGRSLFQSYCAACHQYDGQGVGEAPPLDGSPWVTGPEERLIRIVLHGVRGAMELHGETYDREMPGFGPVLTDEDVASLLSFVRRRLGEHSDPITPAAVGLVRAASGDRTDYWDVEELLAEP